MVPESLPTPSQGGGLVSETAVEQDPGRRGGCVPRPRRLIARGPTTQLENVGAAGAFCWNFVTFLVVVLAYGAMMFV